MENMQTVSGSSLVSHMWYVYRLQKKVRSGLDPGFEAVISATLKCKNNFSFVTSIQYGSLAIKYFISY